MRLVVIFFLVVLSIPTKAQKINFGLDLSSGVTMARVKDDDGRSSDDYYVADGITSKEGNKQFAGLKLSLEKGINDKAYLKTGLWLSQKEFYIRNSDGGYSGVSAYAVSYMQVPVLLKYVVQEVYQNVTVSFDVGPVFEFKSKEKVKGGDGAHFWNLAKNYTVIDPWRGSNGNNKDMNLFGPFDVGMYLSAMGNYKLQENVTLCGGFSLLKSFRNIFNSNIKFKQPYDSNRLTDLLSLKSKVFAIEVGVRVALAGK